MPVEYAEKLYRDYQLLRSLAKVAKKHGRTRQSVWDTLSRRGYALRPLRRKAGDDVVLNSGLKWTPDKNGFLRVTLHDRTPGEKYLHRRIWVAANGPIPLHHEVCFVNGDKLDVRLENLKLLKAGKRCAELGRVQNQFTHSRREKRIADCMGWITKEAIRLSGRFRGVTIDELIQQGSIGIIDADKRFDPSLGYKFLTYASLWIKQRQIRFCLSARQQAVYVPESKIGTVSVVSMNAPAGHDPDSVEIGDLMGSDETVTSDCISAERRALLDRAIVRLPKKIQGVLRARFFDDKTLSEVGIEMGLSRERIRQIEAIGLKRLHRSILCRKAVA